MNRYRVELEQTRNGRRIERNYAVYDQALDSVIVRYADEQRAQNLCDQLNDANEIASD